MGFFDTIDNSMLSNNCLKERTVKCISPEYASFFTKPTKLAGHHQTRQVQVC